MSNFDQVRKDRREEDAERRLDGPSLLCRSFFFFFFFSSFLDLHESRRHLDVNVEARRSLLERVPRLGRVSHFFFFFFFFFWRLFFFVSLFARSVLSRGWKSGLAHVFFFAEGFFFFFFLSHFFFFLCF